MKASKLIDKETRKRMYGKYINIGKQYEYVSFEWVCNKWLKHFSNLK